MSMASALMAGLARTSFDLPRATGSHGTALRVAGRALHDGGAGLWGHCDAAMVESLMVPEVGVE